jgi:hypothetical protein
MKLELKNVKINEAFSEETLMFKADLYVNGKKVAYAENDGRGGCTFYREYSRELRPILEQAEAYCKTLPSKFERTIEIKSDLEHWIDTIVYDISNKKEEDKFKKKLQKDMLKGICYGSDRGYKILSWKGYTLEQLLNRNEGRVHIRKNIQELVDRGETILNTNLPKDNFGNYLF